MKQNKRRSIEEISKEIQANNHSKPTKEQIQELIDIINDLERFDKTLEEKEAPIFSSEEGQEILNRVIPNICKNVSSIEGK